MTLLTRTSAVMARRQVLWILVVRDLKVRYAGSVLGYLWTVLDPLAMSAVYFFVFTFIFKARQIAEQPYILYLIAGLLAWQWFAGSLSDTARALLMEAKLVRSTNLPRELWVVRVVIAKGIEYLLSLPVLAGFAIYYMIQGRVEITPGLLFFPLGLVLEFLLLVGIGLLLAPITALVTDMQRVIRILTRVMFYMTPVIYAVHAAPPKLQPILALNPMTGVLELYRAAFWHGEVSLEPVVSGAIVTVLLLVVGGLVFTRLERAVLKEI